MALFASNIITSDSALGSAVIKKSLKIDQGSSDVDSGSNYSRTFGSGDRKTFTISLWVKKCGTPGNIGDGDDQYSMLSAGGGGSGASAGNFFFYNDDTLRFTSNPQPSTILQLITNRRFRDVTSWYHLMAVLDTTQATESNRAKIYVNGVQETSFSTATYPSQDNTTVYLNGAFQHRVGSNSLGSDISRSYGNFYGYFAEYNFVDGQALDPSSFGFTDPQTGIWMPKRYEGTYGTNGFYLDFTDNTSTTTLGIDKSPNGNDFTPEDVSTTDCLLDTPTNNFCTFNPLDSGSITDSEGNLKATKGANHETIQGTMSMPSGKWYWELYNDDSSGGDGGNLAGLGSNAGGILNSHVGSTATSWGYENNGNLWNNNSGSGAGTIASYANGDIISIAYDADQGIIRFYKNGTIQTTGFTGITADDYMPQVSLYNNGSSWIANFGQDSSFSGNKTSQGNTDASGLGDFYYTAPTGYKALCSKNLSPNVPSIVRPQRFFETVTYTGNGGTSQDISSLEFQPDLIWFKGRNHGGQNVWIDSVRGTNKNIKSDSNAAEGTTTAFLSSFNPNGFTVGQSGTTNGSSETNVAWCWKAGGAAVSNSDGTITTSISANQESGFSIVTYTGTGSAATIGHGLGKTPKLIIVKLRSGSQDWFVNNGMIFNEYGKYYKLSSSSGSDASDTNVFPNTAPTSTVFSVGTDSAVNSSSSTYVAYVWAEIPGFSQFGYWTGNGSTDGPYIHTGFTPRMIIYRKKSDENWHIMDTKRDSLNPNTLGIDPNLSNAEADDSNLSLDFDGSGFKVRSSHSTANTSGTDYFYYTWAEQPGTTPFDTMTNAR